MSPKSLSSKKKPQIRKYKQRSASSRVAIIGGGRGGTALMEIFAEDPLVKVVGLAEILADTTGIRLARRMNIPVTRDFREFLKMKHVDLVIDVTGNPDVERALLEVHVPHIAIVGGASAKFMWQLVEARIRATAEIERTLTRYQSLFGLYVKEEAEGAVNDERTRIACEIHDGLVQTLVGVNLKLELCRALVRKNPVKSSGMLNQTKSQLKHAIQEARQVVYNLRPGQYEKLELFTALSNYLKSYERQHHVHGEFKTVGDESRLDPKTKVFLFRIIQEALSNVAKHAKAKHVKVELTIEDEILTTTITDNGIGFDVESVSKNPEKWDHFGLRGMRERARLLAGEVHWESQKGQGTRVIIQVPIRLNEKGSNGKKS